MIQLKFVPFHPGDPQYRQGDAQHTFRYSLKGKPSFDIGGGIRFGHLGVGIGLSRYSDSEIAMLSVFVPTPLAAGSNTALALADTQDPLQHHETTVHIDPSHQELAPCKRVSFCGSLLLQVDSTNRQRRRR